MKKTNYLLRVVLLTAAVCTSILFAKANTNFYAWEFKEGHTGIACGNLTFKGNDITLEFWINAPSDVVAANSEIMETWHDPNGIRVNMNAHEGGYALRLFAKSTTSTAASIIIPTEYYVEKWAHIAYVISSADEKAYAYVNGEYFAEVPMAGGYYGNYRSDGTSTRALGIARAFWGTPVYNGKLADIRIWSVARTAEEIKANYNKNLAGTYEDNPGLYLNYRFYTYERGFINDANPEVNTNKGWCNPEAGWNNFYARETLSAYPQNLAIAEEVMTWNAGSGQWEIKIFNKEDAEVFTNTVEVNSITLNTINELEKNTVYYAKIRTLNNGFYSGWVTSDDFTVTKTTTGVDMADRSFTITSKGNTLVIKSDAARTMNLYTVEGRLVRVINLEQGENLVSGLSKGVYLINNQKVIIK